MLGKVSLEIVKNSKWGYHSKHFLVQKAAGGWRPIINLSCLNRCIVIFSFKMETVLIRICNVMFSNDLRDTCF